MRAILDRCPVDDPWLLAEDGIVDATAVRVASHGQRPVRLTRRERELAGMAIILRGGSVAIVVSYLRLPMVRASLRPGRLRPGRRPVTLRGSALRGSALRGSAAVSPWRR